MENKTRKHVGTGVPLMYIYSVPIVLFSLYSIESHTPPCLKTGLAVLCPWTVEKS